VLVDTADLVPVDGPGQRHPGVGLRVPVDDVVDVAEVVHHLPLRPEFRRVSAETTSESGLNVYIVNLSGVEALELLQVAVEARAAQTAVYRTRVLRVHDPCFLKCLVLFVNINDVIQNLCACVVGQIADMAHKHLGTVVLRYMTLKVWTLEVLKAVGAGLFDRADPATAPMRVHVARHVNQLVKLLVLELA